MPMTHSSLRLSLYGVMVLLFFLLAANHACALAPTSYTANYRIRFAGFVLGEMHRGFWVDQQTYQLTQKTISSIPLYDYQSIQKSEGQLTFFTPKTNCFTQQFEQKQTHWCYQDPRIQNLIRQTTTGSSQTIYDELSYQLALQHDLMTHKNKFEYWLISDNKLKKYTFEITGHGRLSTPIGMIKTTKLRRINGGKRTTILWLADDYEFLPIAFSQTRPNKPTVDGMIIQLIWKDKSVKL